MSIVFDVLGDPVGKARPRFTLRGNVYTPKKTVEYENKVKQAYISAGGENFGNRPISIIITAFFKKPKYSKSIYPTVKPDADNIAKIILDALNKVAYDDDKQVFYLVVQKEYIDNQKYDIPKVNIWIGG